MTAIPIPPVSRSGNGLLANEGNEELFAVEKIKKSLEKDFATPSVVRKRISRLSQCMQAINSEYIKVHLRLRPFSDDEMKAKEDQGCMKISTDNHVLTLIPPKDSNMYKVNSRGIGDSVHHYTFSKIFDEATQQKELFERTTLPLVEDFVNGNDALVFTYGVTNAGKTYTIHGNPGNEGILPRSIDVIFSNVGDKLIEHDKIQLRMANDIYTASEDELKRIRNKKREILARADELPCENKADSFQSTSRDTLESLPSSDVTQSECGSANNTMIAESSFCPQNLEPPSLSKVSDDSVQGPVKYVMFVSFVEIYKELIYDLTAPSADDKRVKRQSLRLADDKKGKPYVKEINEIQVKSQEEIKKILRLGQRNLHVAATKLNESSSRSHCIFTVTLVQVMDIPEPKLARVSKISFCDLAGSERTNKTREDGIRLKEASRINTSLMKLGMCIEALRYNQTHKSEKQSQRVVPFRESKLTRLFQNFLLGQGRACMIINANMCASSFDETAHVLKFSAITREVQTINKRKDSVAVMKSRATMVVELKQKTMIPSKKPRATICWEFGGSTPIKEEEEEEEVSEVENSDSDSEEESDEESESDEETLTELDVEFWRNREAKFREMINMLKEALIQEEKTRLQSEMEARFEVAKGYKNRIVEIEKDRQDHIESTIEIMEDEQRTRLNSMAKYSSAMLDQAQEQFEKKQVELVMQNKNLEKELEEAKGLVETSVSKEQDLTEKVTSAKLEIESMKLDLEEMRKENASLQRDMKRTRRSTTLFEQNEFIEELQQQNEEGRSIIQSQIVEIEEMKDKADELEQELEKAKKENEQLKESSTGAENGFGKLAEETNECKMLLEKAESDILSQKEQIDALEKERESLKRSLRDAEQNYSETSAALKDALKKERESLKTSLRDAEQNYSETSAALREELEKIKEENNQLKETATGAEKGLEKLAEETSECGMWLEKAENEIVLQKEQIGALEKERDTLKKSISDAEQNNYKGFAVLEDELKKAQNENEQLKESAAGFLKLADETSESKMLLEKAENEIVVQKERITALEKERDTLKISLHDAEQNYSETSAALEAENNSLKEEITRLEAEDKSEVLEAKNEELSLASKRVDELEIEIKTLSCKLEEKSLEVEKANEGLENGVEMKEKAEEKNEELSLAFKHVNELEIEIKTLSRKLEQKTSEVEKANEELENGNEMKEKAEMEHKKVKLELQSKTAEVESLSEDLELMEEKNAKLKSSKEALDDRLIAYEEELEKKDAEMKLKMAIHEEEKKTLISKLEELESTKVKLTELKEQIELLEKDLGEAQKLEKQFIKEIERLHSKAENLKKANISIEETSKKRTSDASDLMQDVKVLSLERDDLLETVERQQQELTKVKMEKEILESQERNLVASSTTVHGNTEIENLKTAMLEMDRTQSEQQALIEKYESEKESDVEERKNMQEDFARLQTTVQDLEERNKTIAQSRDEAEQIRSKLAAALGQKTVQLENLERSCKELEDKLKASSLMEVGEKKAIREEFKAVESSLKEEIEELRGKVKESEESKETEMKKFREGRDRIVEALEIQINNQKSSNEMLKVKLDEQMSDNVHLKSQKARYMAENSHLLKQQERSTKRAMRTSISASALLRVPSVVIKQEPLTDVEIQQDLGSAVDPPAETPVAEQQAPPDLPDEREVENNKENEIDAEEEEKPKPLAKRSTSRGGQAGARKPSTRRKRVNARPGTPIAESVDNDQQDEDVPPPNTRRTRATRTRTTRNTTSKSSSVKTRSLSSEDGVLDDSELMRVTGQSRNFPESTMELDVTPQLSKKATKSRKRAAKKDEDYKPEEGTLTRTKSTRSRNCDKNPPGDEDQQPASLKNLSKVGGMLKNSPVGQALKRIENAISPARQPTTIELPKEQAQRSTRRVKLRPDDISSPLEATSTPEEPKLGRGADRQFVTETPARVMKRLRKRK